MKISFGFHQLHDFAHGTITVLSLLPLLLQQVTKIRLKWRHARFFPLQTTASYFMCHNAIHKKGILRTWETACDPYNTGSWHATDQYEHRCSMFSFCPGKCGVPANTLRNNNVVITSKRRHFVTSKWRRFDVITTLLLRHVFSGVL